MYSINGDLTKVLPRYSRYWDSDFSSPYHCQSYFYCQYDSQNLASAETLY